MYYYRKSISITTKLLLVSVHVFVRLSIQSLEVSAISDKSEHREVGVPVIFLKSLIYSVPSFLSHL